MKTLQALHVGLLVFVLRTAADENDDEKDRRCPRLSFTYRMVLSGDTCYQFYYAAKTWTDARDYCWRHDGRLVKIGNPQKLRFIKTTLQSLGWSTTDLWIGLNDIDNELKWMWVGKKGESGEQMTWSNWHEDHPEAFLHSHRDCIRMSKDGGDWTWHEVACNISPFAYRFICEYEAKNSSRTTDSNGGLVNHHQQTTRPTEANRRTTNQEIITYNTGFRNGNQDFDGEHRRISEGRDHYNSDGEHSKVYGGVADGNLGEQEEKDGGVPLYALVVSFGAGVIFAALIILFIVLRRRRRKKNQAEAYPTVVYHSQPSAETGASVAGSGVVGGRGAMAAGGRDPLACALTGRRCKLAVDMKSGRCSCPCDSQAAQYGQGASANVYVSVPEPGKRALVAGISADPISEGSDPGPSVTSSIRDISMMDEQPPTYDEVCGDIRVTSSTPATPERHAEANQRAENLYTHEPHRPMPSRTEGRPTHRSVESLRQHEELTVSLPQQGAKPKTPREAPADPYLPMNGSPNSHRQDHSTTQYVPMSLSLGELPPIPTDEGYEIPVSSRLEPEALKSLHSPIEECVTPDDAPSSIYAEIPDRRSRTSRLLHNGDQIYASID